MLSRTIILVFLTAFYQQITTSKAINFKVNNSAQDKKISSIILLGDTQRTSGIEFWKEKNTGISKIIFQKIASEYPDFIIHLGDMVFDAASPDSWKQFDYDADNVNNKKILMYPVLGNHEYYGNNKIAKENIISRFPFLEEKTWYSKRINDVGVILLNSNFGELSEEQNLEQLNWYRNELEKFQNDTTINYILAACHHPPFTNSKVVGDDKNVLEKFVIPFISVPKAQLFFSGHCHSYEHFIKHGRHFIVSGGGGGPRQELKTSASGTRHDDSFKGTSLRDFHYCKLSLLYDKILFEMIAVNESGEFKNKDSFSIKRKYN